MLEREARPVHPSCVAALAGVLLDAEAQGMVREPLRPRCNERRSCRRLSVPGGVAFYVGDDTVRGALAVVREVERARSWLHARCWAGRGVVVSMTKLPAELLAAVVAYDVGGRFRSETQGMTAHEHRIWLALEAAAKIRADPDHDRAYLDALNSLRDDQELLRERDRYWQALIDIAGLENWEGRDSGQIARQALGPAVGDEIGR